jgi:hypothetical protein
MDEPSQFILKQLLKEFKERRLTASDLHKGYEGLSIEKLKTSAIDSGISEVDFELTLNDMEKHRFIKTGPWDVASGPINRDLIFHAHNL